MTGSSPFKQLRSLLRRHVPAGCHVSEHEGTQSYYFDDDTAAAAEITVSGDGGIVIAVVRRADGWRGSFVVDIWSRFAEEVWVVDGENQAIEQVAKQQRHTVHDGEAIRSVALPDLQFPLSEVFGGGERA